MKKLSIYFLIYILLIASWPLPVRAAFTDPVAVSFSTTVSTVGASQIQLQGSDADGTALVFSIVASPSHGTISGLIAATGSLVYTPTSGYTGSDSFTYKVTSGGADSNTATVSITVTNAKTRVVDSLLNPDATPRVGKATFILTQAVQSPSGLISASSTVSATLNSSGQFDVSLYPSTALSPQSYYQLWFQDANSTRTELIGLFAIPASAATISLGAYRITDTNLQARYAFVTPAGLEADRTAVASRTLAVLLSGSHTQNKVQKWDTVDGFKDGIATDNGSTFSIGGNLSVTGSVTAGSYVGITSASLPSAIDNKILNNPTINGGTINGATIVGLTISSLNNTTLNAPTINNPSFTGSVQGNITATGNITAAAFIGNGAGLTGIGTGTGGIINTGSTTIGADSDVDGVGKISFQTRGIERISVENDGSVIVTGKMTAPVADKGGAVFFVGAYGIVGAAHGGTPSDESTALLALLNTVNAAGGGTIQFGNRIYRFDSHILIPNDNSGAVGGFSRQPAIKMVGAGSTRIGHIPVSMAGGTVIDLRYVGTGGKLETHGLGTLEISGISFVDQGSYNTTPLFLTTGTTVLIHDNSFTGSCQGSGAPALTSCAQDALWLGGSNTITADNSSNAYFAGYMSVIRDNHFNMIQRAFYGRVYANGITFTDNHIDDKSGGLVAVELNGYSGGASGNTITNQIIEMTNYTKGISLQNAVGNWIVNNQFYDPGAGNTDNVYLGTNAEYNTVISSPQQLIQTTESGVNSNLIIHNHQAWPSYIRQPWVFTDALTVNHSGIGLVNQAANGDQYYDQVDGTAILGSYYKAAAGSPTLVYSFSISGGTDRVLSLAGTTANRIESPNGYLWIKPPVGNALLLGDSSSYARIDSDKLTARKIQIDTGIVASTGVKHQRTSTGSISASSSADVTVNWASGFLDTNYTVIATVLESSAGLEIVSIKSKSTSQVVVTVKNNTGGALTGTLNLIAFHD